MKWCVMFKYIDQKLTGKDCIQINTCSYIIGQQLILLNYDQCSGLNFSHIKTCFDQLTDGFIRKSFLHLFTCIKRYQ